MGFWSWLLKDMNTRDETITPPVSDVLLKALLNNEVITREKALTLPLVHDILAPLETKVRFVNICAPGAG